MWTSPPVTVTAASFTVQNPSKNQNSQPAVAVQIANSSPWLITAQAGAQQFSIQPFVATTIPVALSNDLSIAPQLNVYNLGSGYVQAVWLQTQEQPPQPDGPLTAAATIAAITGTITTAGQLRSLGSFTTPNNVSSGNSDILGLLPTDRYLVVIQTGGGNGIYINDGLGDQTNIAMPVFDVASTLHAANVPLNTVDTGITLQWTSLGVAGSQTGSTFRVFASSSPLTVPLSTGFAVANTAAAVGSQVFTWVYNAQGAGNAPGAIRLRSATLAAHLPTAATTVDLKMNAGGQALMTISAPATTDTSGDRTFGGLLICQGALVDALNHDSNPAQLVLSATSASTFTRAEIDYDVLALV
jgi:hypothetical protein